MATGAPLPCSRPVPPWQLLANRASPVSATATRRPLFPPLLASYLGWPRPSEASERMRPLQGPVATGWAFRLGRRGPSALMAPSDSRIVVGFGWRWGFGLGGPGCWPCDSACWAGDCPVSCSRGGKAPDQLLHDENVAELLADGSGFRPINKGHQAWWPGPVGSGGLGLHLAEQWA